MTVELVFKGDVSPSVVDDALFPSDGGHNIGVSAGSPGFNRHDVTVINRGKENSVQIDGLGKSELSTNTVQSVIDAVPTDHITTRDT